MVPASSKVNYVTPLTKSLESGMAASKHSYSCLTICLLQIDRKSERMSDK